MSTSVLDAPPPGAPLDSRGRPDAAGRRRRRSHHLGNRLLHLYTWLLIAWLALPIAAVALFSFNNPKGRLNILWVGFTLKYWGPKLFQYPELTHAMLNSITIALIATVVSTALGTLIGLALGKHKFRGQNFSNLLQFAAISAPEIVLGSSLLTFFLTLGIQPGYITIAIAHIAFCLSFVAVTVRARALTLDPFIEEAARDLGAGPWETFRLVTLPLIWPGVISGALLAFALSIDDFITTNFVAGSVQTYPLYIWGASREGLPPQVNVMGTIIFMLGAALAIFNSIRARRSRV
jgi:spermidine/putrescine transport system permease protein